MKEFNEKYPWWDWSYFIQMQIDWLENAAEEYRKNSITVSKEEIADSLQEAAGLLREAYEAMEESLFEGDVRKANDQLLEAYEYVVENIRGWWD